MSLKERLATVADIKIIPILTPEWGPDAPTVYVRTTRADERTEVMAIYADVAELAKAKKGEDPTQTARLAAFALCDTQGHREFNQNDPQDVEFLAARDSKVIDRIVMAWLELNGMTEEKVQETEKNS